MPQPKPQPLTDMAHRLSVDGGLGFDRIPDPSPSPHPDATHRFERACLTPEAHYTTHLTERAVTVKVEMPEGVEVPCEGEAAARLEGQLHDQMELVLAPLFGAQAIGATTSERDGKTARERMWAHIVALREPRGVPSLDALVRELKRDAVTGRWVWALTGVASKPKAREVRGRWRRPQWVGDELGRVLLRIKRVEAADGSVGAWVEVQRGEVAGVAGGRAKVRGTAAEVVRVLGGEVVLVGGLMGREARKGAKTERG